MFCPRCRTELPDAASVCSTCGMVVSSPAPPSSAPLPTLSSPVAMSGMPAMSPIPSAALYQPQPASFSYLPAGAPQWPAVAPATVQTPSSSAPATQGPWSTEAAIPAAKPPVRRSSIGIPAMILIFLVCIAIGGGLTFGLLQLGKTNNQSGSNTVVHLGSTPATSNTPVTGGVSPTPTAGDQLPTPASFTPLSNSDVNVSLKYPSDWTVDPPTTTTQSAYIDLHPNPQNGLIINVEHFSTSGSASFKTTSDVNNNNITQLEGVSGLTDFQNVKPATSAQQIGGSRWDEEDVTFQNSNGVTFYFVTIATQYKGQFYDIFYSAPQPLFAEAVQKYFQPMLSSLKFLT